MKFIKLLGWLFIVAFACIFIFLFRLSYDEFVSLVLKVTHYNKAEKITAIISPGKYRVIQLLPIAGVISGLIILACNKFLSGILTKVIKWIRSYFKSFSNDIRMLTKEDKLFLLLFIIVNLGIKVTLAENFPITYDEAWTYLNFTQKGMVSSISYYPAPNNHIFYSLLTNICAIIPMAHQMIVRLPAVLGNVLFILLFYLINKKGFGTKIAVVLTALASFLFPVLYYGFTGRGYTFVLLLFTIIYYVSIKIFDTRDEEKDSYYLFLFSICSVLGFYTMPSFLYPYITLYSALGIWSVFSKRSKLFIKLIYWGVFTIACVVLLYMPVFLISGVKSVTSNSYVHPIPRNEVIRQLLSHFNDTYHFLFSFNYAIVLAFLLCLTALNNRLFRNPSMLNWWLISFSLLIPVLHSVIPFPRTWIYLIVPVLSSLGVLLYSIRIYKLSSVGLAIAALLIIAGTYWYNYRSMQAQEQFSIEEASLCRYMLSNNITSVYVEEPLTDAYILFAYGNAHKQIDCHIDKGSEKNTEISIYRKDKQATISAVPVYRNHFVVVYNNR